MKKIERITKKIEANKELMKNIEAISFFSVEAFIEHAIDYIEAIKKRSMFCVIDSVSSSGMSRVIHFHSWSKCYYRNYWSLFKALGFSEISNSGAFRVYGCGMDMIFHTNYTNMHNFQRLGFISKKQCESLAQNTPQVF
jgi:hypothetical protein